MKKYRRTLPILTMLLLLSGCVAKKTTIELLPTEEQRMTEAEETIPAREIVRETKAASTEEPTVPTATQSSIESEACPSQQAPRETEQTAMEQTETPITEPVVTEPQATELPTTEPTEPIPSTPTAEPEPPTTEAPTEPEQTEAETVEITYEYKRQVASFVAQYLKSSRYFL